MKLYTVAFTEQFEDQTYDATPHYDYDTQTLVAGNFFFSKEDAEEYIRLWETYAGHKLDLQIVEMKVNFGFSIDHYRQALSNGETWASRTDIRRRKR